MKSATNKFNKLRRNLTVSVQCRPDQSFYHKGIDRFLQTNICSIMETRLLRRLTQTLLCILLENAMNKALMDH